MSSEEVDTFSPHNLAVLGGLLFVALILGEAVFPRGSGSGSMGPGTMDEVSMRIEPVITLASIQANAAGSGCNNGDAKKWGNYPRNLIISQKNYARYVEIRLLFPRC